ncbi:hypothetical protein CN288_12540 [Bacillus sp. AFS023182]|uniref:hypothetical protein n=1 Tax=Bacillus sp. AFS023182 TaxID=2033492 RepID=UPI000BF45F9C|nr:hypothetical protein [Bacillus sp. AFS023182]PFE03799.1 hypothetical protein CN288_12540 [Bacillus sp. AFS023182]
MENPALKLHVLLRQARHYCTNNNGNHTPFRNTWSTVFQVDAEDISSLINSMHSMLSLVASTREYIEKNEKLYNEKNLNFLNRIESALSPMNFEGNMNHFLNYIDNETLTALSYMGDNMNFVYDFQEDPIDEEEINNLIDEINNLIDSITYSTLPEDVKSLLFNNLNSIRTSLFNYRISGIEGMKTALGQTIGSLFINNEAISPVVEDENVKGVFKIVDRMNSILSIGVAAKDLIGPVVGFLLNK